MKSQSLAILGLIVTLVTPGGSIRAHHGTRASYDMDKVVSLSGTVTEFAWINPHCQLYLDVKDDAGTIVRWAGELNSPGVLSRAGWTRNTFKKGDRVTLSYHPSLAGTPVGVIEIAEPIMLNGQQVRGTGPGNQ
jgi:hypothetical protein